MAPTGAAAGGEAALIRRIIERLGAAAAAEIVVPPGDDAAAWYADRAVTVATTDALAADSHFRTDTMSWADVGWRAVASNVSDLAAMGAVPRYLLLAVACGPDLDGDALDALTDGIAAAAVHHGVRVAGGDLLRATTTVIAVTALGEAETAGALLRRDAARAGDAVAVTGVLGGAAGGLRAIEAGMEGDPRAAALLDAHRRPVARTAVGRAAVACGVRVACDLSDGLARDLGHVARASGVGVEVALPALPLHPACVEMWGAVAAQRAATGGGEDYELVLLAPAATLAALEGALRALPHAPPLVTIGQAVAGHPGEVWFLDAAGRRVAAPAAGWDPFAEPEPRP